MCEGNKKKLKQKCNELVSLVDMQTDCLNGPNEVEYEMECICQLMKKVVIDIKGLIAR